MYTMGQPVGAAASAHGILRMRSSQHITSFQSSPPLAGILHLLQSTDITTVSAGPAPSVTLITAGLVHQLQRLQCSSPGPAQRLHTQSAFSSSCSRSTLPLLSAVCQLLTLKPSAWIKEFVHLFTTLLNLCCPRFWAPKMNKRNLDTQSDLEIVRSISSSAVTVSWPAFAGLSNLKIPGTTRKMAQDRLHLKKAAADEDIIERPIGTRKVVEHAVFFNMKDSLTDEQEKEMLDSLWSLQYQIKNVICTTVGRLVKKTPQGYTHALFSRFPSKQALDEYMENTIRLRVAQDLVIPFYHNLMILDFEGEVENDIETIFRRGDDFQEGVEHFFFFRFKENVPSNAENKILQAANSMPAKFGDLVQLTAGAVFGSQRAKEIYSHGLVVRLPSEEVRAEYENFLQADPSWGEVMDLCEPSSILSGSFVVSPIGKTVM